MNERFDCKPLVRVIDDEASVRNSEVFLLRIIGLETQAYASAEEFLESGDLERPGCIVTDLRMDGMSGLELQEELAKRKCSLPLIFITGHGTVDTAVFCFKTGACDFLQKPVPPKTLQELVQQWVQKDMEKWRKKKRISSMKQSLEWLTEREREVIRQAALGLSNKEIAQKLGIAEQTVKIHRGNAMHKLQLKTVIDVHTFLKEIGEI